ncbi:hypothetical protein ACERK3_16510 [Phycisphaerales bacterium AB-hyl4]|uniref:DUF4190 domain-containing protein n=1 Tax=Natronomicrosphaera hydrolytica TaxID=3242702 RepID=A0ABV4U9C5_9BACT
MQTAAPDRPIHCPRCSAAFDPPPWEQPHAACPNCNWQGEAYAFDPPPMQVDVQQEALPDDATCVHHPTKQAETVCAGTGDYICSLCAIETGGQTYSAAYVNRVGIESLGEHVRRDLPRPDRVMTTMIVLMFVPFCWFMAPVALIAAAVYFVKMVQLRRDDPLYRQLVGIGHVVTGAVTFAAVSLMITAFVTLIFVSF